jgi:NitT/TauT family transport system permease protein
MNGRPRKRDLVLAMAVTCLAWELVALALDRPVVPPVTTVAEAFVRELVFGSLWVHAAVSLSRVAAGIGLAIAVAVPVGLLLALHPVANRLFSPFVYLLYPIPKIVFVPVLMLLFGVGNAPKILLIALILFSQCLILVRDSASSIRSELINSVRGLGAGPLALLRFVFVPATVPAVLSALRQSIGTALAVLYIAELVATRRGLGYYIHLNGATLMDYPAMYAGIVAMSLLGLGLFALVDALERKTCGWTHTAY